METKRKTQIRQPARGELAALATWTNISEVRRERYRQMVRAVLTAIGGEW